MAATTYFNQQQIQQLWLANGGDPTKAATAAQIALAESGGNSTALNNNPGTGDYSVGLWQINYFGNLLQSRTKALGSPGQLQADPNLQAQAAIKVSNNGQNFTPWSTYNSGAYLNAGNGQGNAGTGNSSASAAGGAGGTGCNLGSQGINIDALSSVPLVGGLAPKVTIFNACQVKGIVGGLLVGLGAAAMLTGVVLIASKSKTVQGAAKTAIGIAVPEAGIATAASRTTRQVAKVPATRSANADKAAREGYDRGAADATSAITEQQRTNAPTSLREENRRKRSEDQYTPRKPIVPKQNTYKRVPSSSSGPAF